jgi:glycopeptide antibiotics resistance protein
MLFGICLGVDLLIQTIKEIDFANSFGVICLHSFAVHDQFLKFFDDYLIFQFFFNIVHICALSQAVDKAGAWITHSTHRGAPGVI